MPNETISPPARYLAPVVVAAVVGLALLAVVTFHALPRDRVTSEPGAGAGTIEVDGRIYPFTAKTCVITDDAFVASGPGVWAEEPFVASVATTGIEVAFGVASDVDQPDPGSLWWTSRGIDHHDVQGGTIRVTAQAQDRSGHVDGPRTAVVQVTCHEAR